MNVMWLAGSVVVIAAGVALYPVFKYMPYAYGTARVRAARARMFTEQELQALAGESYKDAIYHLEKRGLSDLLDLIDADFREDLVQSRLSRDYIEQLDRLTRYVPGKHRAFFRALRERSTYDFIVMVIRSKTSRFQDRHVIREFFPNEQKVEDMSLDDFLATLKGTKYYRVVSDHMDDIKAGRLTGFEEAVSRLRFSELRKAAKGSAELERYAKMLVDIHNVRHAASFGDHAFIEDGRLSGEILKELGKARSIADIVKALADTPYGEFVQNASTVIDIEQAMLRTEKHYGNELLRLQPLSIGQILSYYIHKSIELRNLRILLKLIYVRFQPETIRRLLV